MSAFHKALAYAQGRPSAQALFRQTPEDFKVTEDLGFAASGEGEHLLVQVRKRDANTQWVAKQLARFAGLKPNDVGYCGLKDRRAVTTQWFSLYLPKADALDWSACSVDGVEILQSERHGRKLRPGMNRGNRFEIRLQQLNADVDELEQRLIQARLQGVPNYFGEQRFGHNEGNIDSARRMLAGEIRVRDRKMRGLYLSAARSYIFNLVLSKRVEQQTWASAIAGDVVVDNLGEPIVADANASLQNDQFAQLQWHASGPLWGRGRSAAADQAADLESLVATAEKELCHGLEHVGLSQARRPLRLVAQDFEWHFEDDDGLTLRFSLTPGTYATSVLREILDYRLAAS